MALRAETYNLRELCNELGISLELLKLVRDNKEFVEHKLLEQKPNKKISEVIDEFIKQLEAWVEQDEIKDITANNYKYFLIPFRAFIINSYPEKDISKLTKDLFNEFVSNCRSFKEDKITKGTKNTYLKYIRKLLYFATDKGYLFMNDGERRIKQNFHWDSISILPKYIPDNICISVLKETLKTKNPYRNHTLICFLLGTGARVSELIGVRINDINFIENSLKLTGKFGKSRKVYLYPSLKKVLLSYIELQGIKDFNSGKYLFTSNYAGEIERPLSKSSVQKLIVNLFSNINYANVYSAHSFRHTFAVNCLKAGMNIEHIKDLLGHEHIETTTIYTKLLDVDLLEQVQKYPIPLEEVLFTIIGVNRGEHENETTG